MISSGNLQSWGNHPKIDNNAYEFKTEREADRLIQQLDNFIVFGNGRSYGDSALNKNILLSRRYNHFYSFEIEKNGKSAILKCESGVLLSEILQVFANRGWFPYVTPGTKYITVGGAIAADVHGKNHHVDGTFTESVISFRLLLPDNRIINCSRKENANWFKATCGGMGLTGVILDVRLKLIQIPSTFISQITYKTVNLAETFKVFSEISNHRYSVAWIDVLASKKKLGRALITAGDFCRKKSYNYKENHKLSIPLFLPGFFLNSFTVRIFNILYYLKQRKKILSSTVKLESFFYPLDSIKNWNRLYGRKGFLQYQFILPLNTSFDGMKHILTEISNAKRGSFLAVLKLYGPENENLLSFPMKGYSLALDFKIDRKIFRFLDKLDAIVHSYGGRVYLAKDARLSQKYLESGYNRVNKFRNFRLRHNLQSKIKSLQSERLNI